MLVLALVVTAVAVQAQEGERREEPITAAVVAFQDRTEARGTAQKVTELLTAELGSSPELLLVERDDLERILKELELSLSGAVPASDAVQIGRLTGARLLITGSVIDLEQDRYLVAKVISTETSRVVGATAKGKIGDGLGDLVQKFAGEISVAVREKGRTILPAAVSREDRLARAAARMRTKDRPTVLIQIAESHPGVTSVDPAAQTELMMWCRNLGFKVLDAERGQKSEADLILTGEGISELAGRRGNLVSVRARVEVKVVDRKTGEVVATDRQTVQAIQTTELIAGKQALETAAADIAERLLPQLLTVEPGSRKKR